MPDYGNGKTNINPETGIRYGVISPNAVGDWWWERMIPLYGDPNDVECPKCGHDCSESGQKFDDSLECEECGKNFAIQFPDCDPIAFKLECEGYKAHASAERDIFVIESPYFTYAPFCSPCAPGACHLGSAKDYDESTGEKAYCFGHDCFPDYKAPYRVFEVGTGDEIFSRTV